MDKDILYDLKYIYRYWKGCSVCGDVFSVFCELVFKVFCVEVGCEFIFVVVWECFVDFVDSGDFILGIFIGWIGLGYIVMKSGEDWDCIVVVYDFIVFEMEGVGVWDEVLCIVVKGVCDYVDSYKNKSW